MALGKKKIAIIAGVSVAVLVTALGVGLGVGLSGSSRTPSALDDVLFNDPIKNQVRNGKDLLINGLTFNNKRFNVVEDDNKLFVVIPKNSHLELTQPEFTFNVGGGSRNNWQMGGPDFPETVKTVPSNGETEIRNQTILDNLDIISYGEDYFYTIVFASIGHVKIPNDGFIWGGFHYNSETDKLEKHEALTNGPLKFGIVDQNEGALIDLAVVHEYQQAFKNYDEATTDADKNTAAERMRNADSRNGKENRDRVELTWKILNRLGEAILYSRYASESIATLPINPSTSGTEDYFPSDPTIDSDFNRGDSNKPYVDGNGKFSVSELQCDENNDIHGYWPTQLYHDDKTRVCLEPNNVDENGLATVNQEVSVPLGELNYKLFNFQGGHIKNPLLNKISTTSELTATPDGYVTLSGITDRVRVQEKTNYVVVPSDIKIELDKAPSS